MQKNVTEYKQIFEKAGQSHVFKFWDDLDNERREQLLERVAQVDIDELSSLCKIHLFNHEAQSLDLEGLSPAPYIPHPQNGGDQVQWHEAHARGVEALKANRFAAFVVAGGQGTRLGFDGPKGTFPTTPIRKATLFQVFAEKIVFANQTYGCDIPWFIMTSEINHSATVAFFQEHNYFGLKPERVICFRQGLMPAVDLNGKIIMEDKHLISMSPDGHGGSLRALVRSGAVEQMEKEGRDIISYFQVDNPLVKFIDPAFIGFHLSSGSQMSSKMLPKANAKEKVGNFCVQRGKICVIEYSDLPDVLALETDASGKLRYIAASVGIHILDRKFVKEAGGSGTALSLPFHRAHKKIQTIDAKGSIVKPSEPNGYKFEMFVFDAIPFAKNAVVVETRREDDFSPVKNATGVDSAESTHDDLLREYARWLKAADVPIETDATGLPKIKLEISQKFASDQSSFVKRWKSLANKPAIVDGLIIA